MSVLTTAAIVGLVAASAATSVASAKIQSNAASAAAGTQSASADKALAVQQGVYNDQKAAQAPYQAIGTQALGRLQNYQPSTAQFNPSNYAGGAPRQTPTAPQQPQAPQMTGGQQQALGGQQAPQQPQQQAPSGGNDPIVKLQAPDGSVRQFPQSQAQGVIQRSNGQLKVVS